MKKTLCICTWNRLILGISEMAFIIDSASFFLYSNCKIFQFPRLRRWRPLRKWENRKLYSPKVRRPNKLSNWNLVKWINYKVKKNILGAKLIWTSIKNLSGILSTCFVMTLIQWFLVIKTCRTYSLLVMLLLYWALSFGYHGFRTSQIVYTKFSRYLSISAPKLTYLEVLHGCGASHVCLNLK